MHRPVFIAAAVILLVAVGMTGAGQEKRPRVRDLGIEPGVFPPGPLNAITDVQGVKVGHTTLVQGDRVRTGVTAILPHGGNLFQDKVAGAVFVGNAFGKLAGSTQVTELGTIETPVVFTNTLSVGTAVDAVVAYTLAQEGNANVRSVNALVGETNDGGLNDIRGQHVTRDDVVAAIRNARDGAVPEGSVGAGTGTQCYGWKGGIGTSSRKLPERYGGYTLGVLVQTNFGGVLTIAGAPVGKELGRYSYAPRTRAPGGPRVGDTNARERSGASGPRERPSLAGYGGPRQSDNEAGDGSCMIVVATDAPVDARDLRRIAARAVYGLGRTGASYSNGSGEFAIAFSTSPDMRERFGSSNPKAQNVLPPEGVSPLFEAALEATEEAVYNSLLQATTMSGNGQTVEAIPIARVKEILKKYGMVK
jgi:D-aminopeptidase